MSRHPSHQDILWVIHRINEASKLRSIPTEYGLELDLRSHGDRIILHHDPFKGGENFEDYLEHVNHSLLVLNIKEAGIESRVIEMVKNKGIKHYFLLDVEFPYIYRASRLGVRDIAIRYSEDESIENVLKYKDKVDWVWMDTNTQLPLNDDIVQKLSGMKTCLVCPERWGRPQDITTYAQKMKELNFKPTAIMTALDHVDTWKTAMGSTN